MRYKLVTLPKNTAKMPVIAASPLSISFSAAAGLNQPVQIVSVVTANVPDSSYTFILHDQTVADITVEQGAGDGASASTPFFLGDDDAPNSKTLTAKTVRVSVVAIGGDKAKATQLTIIGNETGATSTITIINEITLSLLANQNK
tara:strand:- start:361 stop:795 length:435 start_codon:yes stop_codon:yes gene_type:complete